MVRGPQITLLSLTQEPHLFSDQDEAIKYFQRQQKLVQELEALYLTACMNQSNQEDRDFARSRCVNAQERLDELTARYGRIFPKCQSFRDDQEVAEEDLVSVYDEEPVAMDVDDDKEEEEQGRITSIKPLIPAVMFQPTAQDFADGMERDVKEIAALVRCEWRSLLPKALDDLEQSWRAAERAGGEPAQLTWSEVRTAVVRKFNLD